MVWWQIILALVPAIALVLLSVLYTSQLDTDDIYGVIKDAREKKACEEGAGTVAEKRLAKTQLVGTKR